MKASLKGDGGKGKNGGWGQVTGNRGVDTCAVLRHTVQCTAVLRCVVQLIAMMYGNYEAADL